MMVPNGLSLNTFSLTTLPNTLHNLPSARASDSGLAQGSPDGHLRPQVAYRYVLFGLHGAWHMK